MFQLEFTCYNVKLPRPVMKSLYYYVMLLNAVNCRLCHMFFIALHFFLIYMKIKTKTDFTVLMSGFI